MECDICGDVSHDRSKFHCPACARAVLYPHRLEHARVLLNKEKLGKSIDHSVRGTPATSSKATAVNPSAFSPQAIFKLQHERNLSDVQRSQERVAVVVRRSKELQQKIDAYRRELASQKLALERRRRDKSAAVKELQQIRSSTLEPLRKQTRKTQHRLDSQATYLSFSRASLCNMAAKIMSLQPIPSSIPPTISSDIRPPTYELAQLPIPDLRDLNRYSISHINTSTTRIVYLLTVTCSYLSIRLPAEIQPPCQDSPHTWVIPPASSYEPPPAKFPYPGLGQNASASTFLKPKALDVAFRPTPTRSTTTSNASSRPSAPTRSTTTTKPPPQPLKLSIDRPRPSARPLFLTPKTPPKTTDAASTPPQIAHDDPSQWSIFLEAITLLAWDIAWLCRVQGVDVASNSFEDVCAIGRNLHALFVVAAGAKEKQYREASTSSSSKRRETARAGTGTGTGTDGGSFGRRTHGSAAGFFAGSILASSVPASASEAVPQLPDPQLVRDQLRSHLLAEMQGAEWHLLEDEDLKPMAEEEDVLVRKGKGKGRKLVRPLGGEVGELVERLAEARDGGRDLDGGPSVVRSQGIDGVHQGERECGGIEESEDEILARTMYAEGDERRRRNGYTIVKHRPP